MKLRYEDRSKPGQLAKYPVAHHQERLATHLKKLEAEDVIERVNPAEPIDCILNIAISKKVQGSIRIANKDYQADGNKNFCLPYQAEDEAKDEAKTSVGSNFCQAENETKAKCQADNDKNLILLYQAENEEDKAKYQAETGVGADFC